jgi:RNA-dependent RNA polymerase
LAKYQTAFLNRQFIMIMCANGVPDELIVKIFEDAIHKIKGLKGRVMEQKMTADDKRLLTLCSDVSPKILLMHSAAS